MLVLLLFREVLYHCNNLSFDKLIFDHARWGGSGALNLQPAIAGLNPCPRLFSVRTAHCRR